MSRKILEGLEQAVRHSMGDASAGRSAMLEGVLFGCIRDENRSYIKDEIDMLAVELYKEQNPGRLPPERPNGFLDDREVSAWGRWRQRAEAMLNGVK